MSDRCPGSIEIGGTVPAKRARAFLRRLKESGAGEDWEGGLDEDLDVAGLRELVAADRMQRKLMAINEEKRHAEQEGREPDFSEIEDDLGPKVLRLHDSDAVGGVFESLEAWLIKKKIPFSRYTDAMDDYDGEIVHYRPGHAFRDGSDRLVLTASADGNTEHVDADDVRALLKLFPTPIGREANAQEMRESLAALREAIDELAEPVPPLPPFAIEDPPVKEARQFCEECGADVSDAKEKDGPGPQHKESCSLFEDEAEAS